mmetsp:Transcript_95727/g.270928  ORF Transcript_95727/g.270928 Transcript_95727/m.270928 type:complete len:122 (-) Transcript_95727:65-430(-)
MLGAATAAPQVPRLFAAALVLGTRPLGFFAWPGQYYWAYKDGYACMDRRWAQGPGARNLNISKAMCELDPACGGMTDFTPNSGFVAFCANGSNFRVFYGVRSFFKSSTALFPNASEAHWLD